VNAFPPEIPFENETGLYLVTLTEFRKREGIKPIQNGGRNELGSWYTSNNTSYKPQNTFFLGLDFVWKYHSLKFAFWNTRSDFPIENLARLPTRFSMDFTHGNGRE
jgi:hypothetical protein